MSKRGCVNRSSLAIGLFLSLGMIGCSEEKQVPLPPLPQLKMDEMFAVNREQIKKFYTQALQTPTDAEAVGRLGMVLHAYQQHESAEPCYHRAHLLQPDDLRWAYYLGTVRFLLGHDDAAVDALKIATSLDTQYLPAQLRLADTLLSLERLDDAEAGYESVIEKDAQSALAYYGLGKVHSDRGDIETAIEYFSKACEISEGFPGAHYALALAYRDTGQSKKAEEHFALHEKYSSVLVALNDPLLAALKELKVSGAIEHFKEGLSLADTGNLTEAAEAFERAVAVNPGLVQARINLISVYARLGQTAEAEKQYLQAVETDPERADLHVNYGVLLGDKGEIQAAQNAFEKALSIDSEYAEAHTGLGQILAAQGRTDEAIQHFQRALASSPNDRFAHSNLGRLLLVRGQKEKGIQHFLRTLEPQDEQTPGYLFDTAVAYAMTGEREKAVHYAQQANQHAVSLGQAEIAQFAKEFLQELGQAELE